MTLLVCFSSIFSVAKPAILYNLHYFVYYFHHFSYFVMCFCSYVSLPQMCVKCELHIFVVEEKRDISLTI